MGAVSCAASGCHGQEATGSSRDWQTSYSVWLQEDPHRRAFQVLYTERAIEMYRNLNPAAEWSSEAPNDSDYLSFLSASCIGCHATGLLGRHAVATVEPDDGALFYLGGVGCESCHGPASAWLDSHYLASFSRGTNGFHDTRPLASRGEACVGCHVGPVIAENGKAFDVTHDTVAAGHPRLAFELSSYLANLPKHWDANEDVARNRETTGSTAASSDIWAHGQEQVARQLARQIEHRLAAAKRSPNSSPWPDFANYECRDCHHPIAVLNTDHRAEAWADGHPGPRPALAPLAMLRIISATPSDKNSAASVAIGKIEALLMASWRVPVTNLEQPTADDLVVLTARGRPAITRFLNPDRPRQQAEWLLARIQSWKQTPGANSPAPRSNASWDQALQLHLCASALARDFEPQIAGPLRAAVDLLGASLGQASFRNLGRPATQYDSPSDFDSETIERDLDRLEAALSNFMQSNSPAGPP